MPLTRRSPATPGSGMILAANAGLDQLPRGETLPLACPDLIRS